MKRKAPVTVIGIASVRAHRGTFEGYISLYKPFHRQHIRPFQLIKLQASSIAFLATQATGHVLSISCTIDPLILF